MSVTPTVARTRTPPDVKWMLNERAALAGEVRKANVTQGRLLAKRDKLQRQLSAVDAQLSRSRVAESRAQASIDALGATMALAHSRVEPSAGGTVCAWAGKYGKRGGLGAFIEGLLRNAAPEPVTTTVLINLASQNFALSLPLPKDRRAFRKSVSSALTSLLKRRLIEPMHSRDEGSHGLWRWTGGQVTLAALQLRVNSAGTNLGLSGDQVAGAGTRSAPSGHQVAGSGESAIQRGNAGEAEYWSAQKESE